MAKGSYKYNGTVSITIGGERGLMTPIPIS